MSETDLVNGALRALELRRIWAWRANSGTTVLKTTKSRRVIKGAPAGTPDVLLILPGGRLAGIELKSPTGRVRSTQKIWSEKAKRHGVRWGVARSVSEVMRLIDKWLFEVGGDIDKELRESLKALGAGNE